MTDYAAQLTDVEAAARRLAGRVHRTPVWTSSTFDRWAGRSLFFKCEALQRGGSFKIRGALNAVLSLDPAARARGVVTHSSGNHAQAVAIAAREVGVPAHIVMPTHAPAVKRAAVEGYGARVIDCAPTQADRVATCAQVAAATGGAIIPPYDHPDVIAGQGTIALELIEQVPDLDAVIVPVGGGGMVSGIATVCAAHGVRVFGAEPAGADDAARSKASGARVLEQTPDTVADGLRTTLGVHTWPIVRDRVERIFTVEEAEIIDGMRRVWERLKLVVEPSAGVGPAVALQPAFRALEGLDRVAIVLCGGNVDVTKLPF